MQATGYEQNRGGVDRGITGAMSSVQHSAQDMVDQRPISTALVVFGAGVGVGLMIGCAIADSRLTRSGGNSVESFGHRVLESMAGLVPNAVSQQFTR